MRHLFSLTSFRYLPLLFLLLLSAKSNSVELKAAVASNFVFTFNEIAAEFQKQYDHSIKVSSGSSGKLYSQIRSGAPFDLFFSADEDKPERLIENGLALKDTQFVYAKGALVLWSTTLDDNLENKLRNKEFKSLAIANPKIAPYGLASQEVLNALNIENVGSHPWVLGENISQTFQFVYSGAAELGFVSLSHLYQLNKNSSQKYGNVWLVPSDLYSPINQSAVILKHSQNQEAAKLFFGFFKKDAVKKMLQKHGYNKRL